MRAKRCRDSYLVSKFLKARADLTAETTVTTVTRTEAKPAEDEDEEIEDLEVKLDRKSCLLFCTSFYGKFEEFLSGLFIKDKRLSFVSVQRLNSNLL